MAGMDYPLDLCLLYPELDINLHQLMLFVKLLQCITHYKIILSNI